MALLVKVAPVSRSMYCSLWSCSNTSWVVRVQVPSRSALCQWQNANAPTDSDAEQQVLAPVGAVNQIDRLQRAAAGPVQEDCCTCASCGKKKCT